MSKATKKSDSETVDDKVTGKQMKDGKKADSSKERKPNSSSKKSPPKKDKPKSESSLPVKSAIKKDSDSIASDTQVETLMIVPPDGGWGWMIVIISFIILICSDGSTNSFGPYGAFSTNIETEFGATVASVSLINSFGTCFYYMTGPAWGALGTRFGFRKICFVGAALMAVGNACAFFVKKTSSFAVFAAFYSIGVGVGGGMVFMATFITVGLYFERWRGVAISIVSCGSSLGTVFLPPAYTSVTLKAGWRYVLILNSGLMTLCMFLSLLLRPLKPVMVVSKSVHFKPGDGEPSRSMQDRIRGRSVSKSIQSSVHMAGNLAASSSFVTLKQAGTHGGSATSIYISAQDAGLHAQSAVIADSALANNIGQTPMYRDDIFYAASSSRLESQTMNRTVVFSAPRLPSADEEEHKRRCRFFSLCCPPVVTRVLAALLDVSLLKSPVFIGISLSQSICMLSYHVPFLFSTARAHAANQMDPSNVYWLLPLTGIANTIGRMLCGIIVELPGISALHLTAVSYALAGLFTILSCLDNSHPFQYAYVCLFGLMAAAFMSMKSIILVDVIGIERLTNAFGLLLMFQGISSLLGPPLAGMIADKTGDYNWSFITAGILAIIGGLGHYVVYPLRRLEMRRENNQTST